MCRLPEPFEEGIPGIGTGYQRRAPEPFTGQGPGVGGSNLLDGGTQKLRG
ncbi:MAG TPA: hypothetical protein PLR71_01610 [Deltaproteobacteria bacterium]|nr:hypothetical protein [Deltaproteobacteria bacterium]